MIDAVSNDQRPRVRNRTSNNNNISGRIVYTQSRRAVQQCETNAKPKSLSDKQSRMFTNDAIWFGLREDEKRLKRRRKNENKNRFFCGGVKTNTIRLCVCVCSLTRAYCAPLCSVALFCVERFIFIAIVIRDGQNLDLCVRQWRQCEY